MAQYIEIKAANPDSLLFYRMGDFYEMFFEDAEIASRVLGIVLTKRGKHGGEDIPMCGVPIARADDYLQRLIAAGYRVAVCEQLEDPAEAKKRGSKAVVRRDVVRLVTPGTITEEALLAPGRPSLLACLARLRESEGADALALAVADISTGRFEVLTVSPDALMGELARIEPSELVCPESLREEATYAALFERPAPPVTLAGRDIFDGTGADERLKRWFGLATLDGLDLPGRTERLAAAALIAYVEKTQKGQRVPLELPRSAALSDILAVDAASRANLELVRTLSGERRGTLLASIDRTATPRRRTVAGRTSRLAADTACRNRTAA